jgi:pseudouridine synthase
VKQRLQKIISRSGLASRRTAERWILGGRVSVNGEVIRELGTKADPAADVVEVDGKRIAGIPAPPVYYVLNKPAGFVTTLRDPQGRPTVIDLLKRVRRRVFPVGRLDFVSTGMLILTDDGELAMKLQHPSSQIPRVYDVKIIGKLTDVSVRKLQRGVSLGNKKTQPCSIQVRKTSERSQWLRVTLREGQNRQIHRMMASVGISVSKLRRVQFGPLRLGRLAVGQYRRLTPSEVTSLRNSC